MKLQIRFFAIGLLTAAILLFAFYFIIDETEATLDNVPVEEMIEKVEENGYRVITEDEFISYSFYLEEKHQKESKEENSDKKSNDKNSKDKKDKDKNEKKDNDKNKTDDKDEKKDEVKKVSFTVKEGFVSNDIADILVENGIIDDSAKFVKYLEDNNYSPYIQLGTFEVTSDMSYKELAETITTYPGN